MYRVRVVVPMAIAILMGPLVGHVGAQGAAVALTATRLDPVAGEISDANPNLVGMANGVPIFQISQSATGQEFWSLTPSGLTILKDIAPGSSSGGASNFTRVSGGAYFSANDETNGRELWFTDGTSAGTRLVKDTVAGSGGGYPTGITVLGTKTVFRMTANGTDPCQLWVTDGTDAGTYALTSIAFDPSDDGVQGVLRVPNTSTAVFIVRRTSQPIELWVTDGTVMGTTLVKVFDEAGSGPVYTGVASGNFAYLSQSGQNRLWRTDGTAAGTVIVKTFDGSGTPAAEFDFNGKLFFTANTTANGIEPWLTDGTTAGTVALGDLRSGTGASRPYNYGVYAGRLFFSADDGVHGRELWSTTGTAAGTRLHADTQPGITDGYAEAIVGRGGRLYYIAYNAAGDAGSLWYVNPSTVGSQIKVAGQVGTFTQFWDQQLLDGVLYFTGRIDETITGSEGVPAYNVYSVTLAAATATLTKTPVVTGKRAAVSPSWRTAYSPDRAVTSYVIRVYKSSTSRSAYKVKIVSASLRTTTVSGLLRNRSYWVTVQPVTGLVAGRQSARVKVRTR